MNDGTASVDRFGESIYIYICVNCHRKRQMSYTENQQTLFLFPLFIDARGSRLTYNQNTGTSQLYNYKYLQQATYELGSAPSWPTGVERLVTRKRSRGHPELLTTTYASKHFATSPIIYAILEKTLSLIQAIITSHNLLQVYAISQTTWARESPLPSARNRGTPSP